MCRCARLKADKAGWQGFEIVENLRSSQLDLSNCAACRIGGMHLENLLCDIESNNTDLHGKPPADWSAPAAIMPRRCRGAGAVHPINGRFRDECLNDTLFSTLTEARSAITSWKEDYNHHRPHSALGNMPPAEFAMKSTLEKQAA